MALPSFNEVNIPSDSEEEIDYKGNLREINGKGNQL